MERSNAGRRWMAKKWGYKRLGGTATIKNSSSVGVARPQECMVGFVSTERAGMDPVLCWQVLAEPSAGGMAVDVEADADFLPIGARSLLSLLKRAQMGLPSENFVLSVGWLGRRWPLSAQRMQTPAADRGLVPASGKGFGAKWLTVLEEMPQNWGSSCENSLDSTFSTSTCCKALFFAIVYLSL